MPWECHLVKSHAEGLNIGDMWYAPEMLEGPHKDFYLKHYLSRDYKTNWINKRPPLIVVLPGGFRFCIDCMASTAVEDEGWTVTGDAPIITIFPSLNYIGHYHGWLRGGLLSDDIDGRTYPDA